MSEIAAERDSWQYRAIQYTRGNSTPLGALLLAILGRNAKHPPWFGRSAVITAEGHVVTSVTTKDYVTHFPHRVGSVQDLTGMFSRLADELKLKDEDRVALFREVRQWCARDHRADITMHFTSGD